MSDQKISALDALVAAPASTDEFVLVDKSDTTMAASGTDKRITLPNIMKAIYPVGAIYSEITGVNPNTTFGFGTWVAFGVGKVPVGYDAGDADFDAAEETGGAKTVTLSAAESGVPAHSHNILSSGRARIVNPDTGADADSLTGSTYKLNDITAVQNNTTAAASSGHNNVQPYIVVHMWKRTV